MSSTHERLDPVESGKALRKALRNEFPGTKFSVRMSRGTAYGYFTVQWTDGPTAEAVHGVTDRFQGETFDGMTDSVEHHDKPIEWKGQTWRSGCGIINVRREHSDEFLAEVTDEIMAEYPSADREQVMRCGGARQVAHGLERGEKATLQAMHIANSHHHFARD